MAIWQQGIMYTFFKSEKDTYITSENKKKNMSSSTQAFHLKLSFIKIKLKKIRKNSFRYI